MFPGLLILDLNGTLVHSSHKRVPHALANWKARNKFVYIRPYLQEFLNYIFANFEAVAVWTSNIKENAESICDLIFTPEQRKRLLFVWSRNECEKRPNYHTVKNLQHVWASLEMFSPENTFVMDDSRDKILPAHQGNLLLIDTYFPTAISMHTDCVLLELAESTLPTMINKRMMPITVE